MNKLLGLMYQNWLHIPLYGPKMICSQLGAFKNNSVLYCLTSVRKIEIIQNERTFVHFTPLRKTTTRLILGRS